MYIQRNADAVWWCVSCSGYWLLFSLGCDLHIQLFKRSELKPEDVFLCYTFWLRATVAQWQSSGFVNRLSEVRLLSLAPLRRLCLSGRLWLRGFDDYPLTIAISGAGDSDLPGVSIGVSGRQPGSEFNGFSVFSAFQNRYRAGVVKDL